MKKEFKTRYMIEMVSKKELSNIAKGEIVYYVLNSSKSNYTDDPNIAWYTTNLEEAIYISKEISRLGDFTPSIKEVRISFGRSLNLDLDLININK